MRCANEFCIYQMFDSCMLDTVELDVNGQCRECIQVELPKNMLVKHKIHLRKKLEHPMGK